MCLLTIFHHNYLINSLKSKNKFRGGERQTAKLINQQNIYSQLFRSVNIKLRTTKRKIPKCKLALFYLLRTYKFSKFDPICASCLTDMKFNKKNSEAGHTLTANI